MTLRSFLPLVTAVLLTLATFTATAAPKDAAATAKIDEAINTHYLATDFDKAEAQLLGIIKACGADGCSPAVLGKANMYVGIVRGCGKQDLAGAKEAFQSAKEADPATGLDTAISTPEVQTVFEEVFGAGAAATSSVPPPTPATNDVTAAVAAGTVSCTPPSMAEIETNRPIPVTCKALKGATKAVLSYKEFGGDAFVELPMKLESGSFQVAIPCSATKMEGNVEFTVTMKNGAGAVVGSMGTPDAAEQFSIVKSTTQPPPAFPGQAPPGRCSGGDNLECPPGMPGCSGGGGWGDSCTPAATCKKGLYCESGTCANAPSCETDSDCASGRCSEGFCDMGDSGSGSSSAVKKFWVGLHFGVDFLWVSAAKNVCSYPNISSRKYACYPAGGTTAIYGSNAIPGSDQPNYTPVADGGEVKASGFVLATMRAMLSGDYAVTPSVTLGGRLGFAFRGGPDNVTYKTIDLAATGSKFLPVHAEGRGTYWIRSLGQPGIRPYVHVGGGLAQVDAKIVTTDVRLRPQPVAAPTVEDPNATVIGEPVASYDVYKKVGQGFVTLGGGAMLPLGSHMGIVGNLNFMYMLPDSGIVLEPSIGMAMGL